MMNTKLKIEQQEKLLQNVTIFTQHHGSWSVEEELQYLSDIIYGLRLYYEDMRPKSVWADVDELDMRDRVISKMEELESEILEESEHAYQLA